MYKVYTTQGQDPILVGDYPTLYDALMEAKQDGNYRIEYPTGEWYDWLDTED